MRAAAASSSTLPTSPSLEALRSRDDEELSFGESEHDVRLPLDEEFPRDGDEGPPREAEEEEEDEQEQHHVSTIRTSPPRSPPQPKRPLAEVMREVAGWSEALVVSWKTSTATDSSSDEDDGQQHGENFDDNGKRRVEGWSPSPPSAATGALSPTIVAAAPDDDHDDDDAESSSSVATVRAVGGDYETSCEEEDHRQMIPTGDLFDVWEVEGILSLKALLTLGEPSSSGARAASRKELLMDEETVIVDLLAFSRISRRFSSDDNSSEKTRDAGMECTSPVSSTRDVGIATEPRAEDTLFYCDVGVETSPLLANEFDGIDFVGIEDDDRGGRPEEEMIGLEQHQVGEKGEEEDNLRVNEVVEGEAIAEVTESHRYPEKQLTRRVVVVPSGMTTSNHKRPRIQYFIPAPTNPEKKKKTKRLFSKPRTTALVPPPRRSSSLDSTSSVPSCSLKMDVGLMNRWSISEQRRLSFLRRNPPTPPPPQERHNNNNNNDKRRRRVMV